MRTTKTREGRQASGGGTAVGAGRVLFLPARREEIVGRLALLVLGAAESSGANSEERASVCTREDSRTLAGRWRRNMLNVLMSCVCRC